MGFASRGLPDAMFYIKDITVRDTKIPNDISHCIPTAQLRPAAEWHKICGVESFLNSTDEASYLGRKDPSPILLRPTIPCAGPSRVLMHSAHRVCNG